MNSIEQSHKFPCGRSNSSQPCRVVSAFVDLGRVISVRKWPFPMSGVGPRYASPFHRKWVRYYSYLHPIPSSSRFCREYRERRFWPRQKSGTKNNLLFNFREKILLLHAPGTVTRQLYCKVYTISIKTAGWHRMACVDTSIIFAGNLMKRINSMPLMDAVWPCNWWKWFVSIPWYEGSLTPTKFRNGRGLKGIAPRENPKR